MDINAFVPLADLLAHVEEQWHQTKCPDACSYRADDLEHGHEEHQDGSRAIWGMQNDLWELLEFQGTLGF